MNFIGINAFHPDSAVALVTDGSVVWAAEEERFTRIKHDPRFPENALLSCLTDNGLALKDIDCITIVGNRNANLLRKLIYAGLSLNGLKIAMNRMNPAARKISLEQRIHSVLKKYDPNHVPGSVNISFAEHHLCHIGSSYLCSGFRNADLLSIDGMGDFASTVIGSATGGSIEIFNRVYFPSSLGFFYTAVTQHLGFLNYGDEYKVMGLASYGNPVYQKKFKDIIHLKNNGLFKLNLKYFQFPTGSEFSNWEKGILFIPNLYSDYWIKQLGPARKPEEEITQRHKDIAASAQAALENIYFHILRNLHNKTGNSQLCLSGGVAYNCVANGKIYNETPYREIYIPPASGDAGTAVGAALSEYRNRIPSGKLGVLSSALLGPKYSDKEIEKILSDNKGLVYTNLNEDGLCEFVSEKICEGAVIGWFQDHMEFGPRALGARSILADPRRSDIKDLLNIKVKFREKFRPFAPVVKEESASEYFDMKSCSSPFMMNVFKVLPEYQKVLAGVTHVDLTARVQTVSKSSYPLFWKLLDCMERRTKCAVLLNTSFNENEPIVNRPEEAVDCFLRTEMDYLAIGSFIVSRKSSDE